MIALRKTLIIVTLLVSVLLRKLNCLCVNCHLPQNAREEADIVKFATWDFKQRLMKKLGMKTEPKGAPFLPKEIINSIVGPFAADQPRPSVKETKKIKSIVITPSNSVKVAWNTYSYTFKVLSKIRGSYEVSDVRLWLPFHINRTKNHRLRVYEKTRDGKFLLLKVSVNSLASVWQTFKLGPSKVWMETPWKELHLEIEWITVALFTANMQPHLQLQTRPVKKRLHKRSGNIVPTDDCSTDMNKRNLCCRHTMSLNLSLQMPWIMTPTHIQARVCKGDCPVLHRTRVPYTFLAQLEKNRKPCCVPTQLAPISVIFYENGEVKSTEVNDMIVNSCGCF